MSVVGFAVKIAPMIPCTYQGVACVWMGLGNKINQLP